MTHVNIITYSHQYLVKLYITRRYDCLHNCIVATLDYLKSTCNVTGVLPLTINQCIFIYLINVSFFSEKVDLTLFTCK